MDTASGAHVTDARAGWPAAHARPTRTPRTDLAYDSALTTNPFLDEIRAVVRYRALLGELILSQIKSRYKRSALGVAWTMVNPLLTMLVMLVVFSNLFSISLERYPVYLLSGLLVWNFFSGATVTAMNQLRWGGSVLRSIYVPRTLFALAAVGNGIINLFLALIPLAVILLLTGTPFRPALLFLPVAIAVAGVFCVGVGLAVSMLAAFFADVVEIYQVLLLAWMYLTPIFYPVEILAPQFRWIIALNPMYYILEIFRAPIYLGRLPDLGAFVLASLIALAAFVIGGVVFTRKSDELAYRI